MKKIAVVGTVGLPAKYGGFETLVENITGTNASPNVHYTVYCSTKSYKDRQKIYKGTSLKYVPLKANGSQSIPYDIISIIRAICSDANIVLVLGVSGAIILPYVRFFSKKKIIVNIDGLEHKRDKWSPRTRKLLRWLEKMAVKNCDVVVADNQAIAQYVEQEYGVKAEMIAYGGDHVMCQTADIEVQILKKYSLQANQYSFSLCRIEPENNVHLTLEAFSNHADKRIVIVGNWQNSEYGRNLVEQYGSKPNIDLLNPIYDIPTLNVIRANCSSYIHGHSAGGTNPSLVEAMFFGKPILAYDVLYNRYTTGDNALYYNSVQELQTLIANSLGDGEAMKELASQRYLWKTIARQYEALY